MSALYLLNVGYYSDQRVLALLEGAPDLDIAALAAAFGPLFDHGESVVRAHCVHPRGLLSGEPPCAHERARQEIRSWRTQQGWPPSDPHEAFVLWLVREHACTRRTYAEVDLDDLSMLALHGPTAYLRVLYDPSYNGDGSDYERTHARSGTLRAVYVPASVLTPWENPRVILGRWLERQLHLSAGNLVSYDLDTFYDAHGAALPPWPSYVPPSC